MNELSLNRSLTTRQQFRLVFILFATFAVVELVNMFTGRMLNQFGLVPRYIDTWPGLFFGPWLHGSAWHFFSNIVPLCIFFFLMLQHSTRTFVLVSLWILLFTGVLVWVFGRQAVHIGASGLVYGYFGFLVVAGFLSGRPKLMIIAFLVGFFYGGLIWGVLPGRPHISWESHMFGFFAGVLAAWYGAKR